MLTIVCMAFQHIAHVRRELAPVVFSETAKTKLQLAVHPQIQVAVFFHAMSTT